MGGYLKHKGYIPDFVLCSTSRRTRETLDLLLPSFRPEPKIRYSRSLYLAEWPALLAAVKDMPRTYPTALLVGHNPGMEQLSVALARKAAASPEKERTQRLAEKFPTCALAVLDFDVRDWNGIEAGAGALVDYVRPKDLSDDEEND